MDRKTQIEILAEMIIRMSARIRELDNTVMKRYCPKCENVSDMARNAACPHCGERRKLKR